MDSNNLNKNTNMPGVESSKNKGFNMPFPVFMICSLMFIMLFLYIMASGLCFILNTINGSNAEVNKTFGENINQVEYDNYNTYNTYNSYPYLTETSVLYNSDNFHSDSVDCDFNNFVAWNPETVTGDIGSGDGFTFEKLILNGEFYDFIVESLSYQGITDISSLHDMRVFIELRGLELTGINKDRNIIYLKPIIPEFENLKSFTIDGAVFEHTFVDTHSNIEIGSEVEIRGVVSSNVSPENCTIYVLDIKDMSEKIE